MVREIDASTVFVPFDIAAVFLGSMNGFDVVVAVGVVRSSSSLSSFSSSSSMFSCTSIDSTFKAFGDSSCSTLFSSCIAISSPLRLSS